MPAVLARFCISVTKTGSYRNAEFERSTPETVWWVGDTRVAKIYYIRFIFQNNYGLLQIHIEFISQTREGSVFVPDQLNKFPQGKIVMLQILWVLAYFPFSCISLNTCDLTNFPWGKKTLIDKYYE